MGRVQGSGFRQDQDRDFQLLEVPICHGESSVRTRRVFDSADLRQRPVDGDVAGRVERDIVAVVCEWREGIVRGAWGCRSRDIGSEDGSGECGSGPRQGLADTKENPDPFSSPAGRVRRDLVRRAPGRQRNRDFGSAEAYHAGGEREWVLRTTLGVVYLSVREGP